jgi:hypothetical protein
MSTYSFLGTEVRELCSYPFPQISAIRLLQVVNSGELGFFDTQVKRLLIPTFLRNRAKSF